MIISVDLESLAYRPVKISADEQIEFYPSGVIGSLESGLTELKRLIRQNVDHQIFKHDYLTEINRSIISLAEQIQAAGHTGSELVLLMIGDERDARVISLVPETISLTSNGVIKTYFCDHSRSLITGVLSLLQYESLSGVSLIEFEERRLSRTEYQISKNKVTVAKKDSIEIDPEYFNESVKKSVSLVTQIEYPKKEIKEYEADPDWDATLSNGITVSEYSLRRDEIDEACQKAGLYQKIMELIPESTEVPALIFSDLFNNEYYFHKLLQTKDQSSFIENFPYTWFQRSLYIGAVEQCCREMPEEKACGISIALIIFNFNSEKWVEEELELISSGMSVTEAFRPHFSPTGFEDTPNSYLIHRISIRDRNGKAIFTKEIAFRNDTGIIRPGSFYAMGFSVSDKREIVTFIKNENNDHQIIETFTFE